MSTCAFISSLYLFTIDGDSKSNGETIVGGTEEIEFFNRTEVNFVFDPIPVSLMLRLPGQYQ